MLRNLLVALEQAKFTILIYFIIGLAFLIH